MAKSFSPNGAIAQISFSDTFLRQDSLAAGSKPSLGIIMQIRKLTVLSLVILGLALAPFSFGQFASRTQTPHRVLGYYDPATGIFSAVLLNVGGIKCAMHFLHFSVDHSVSSLRFS